MKVPESELRGKTVMSADGLYMGVLRALSANTSTGDLTTIHIEPSDEVDRRLHNLDGEGRITLPFESIKAIRDVIVVAA